MGILLTKGTAEKSLGKPCSELWESYWPKIKPVISNDQAHRKTLSCRSPRKTARSHPLFKIYFFTQEIWPFFISQDLKKLWVARLFYPLGLPNQILSATQKTQFKQEQEQR